MPIDHFAGLPGNVGSIFVSRLSTALHAETFALNGFVTTSMEDLDKVPHPPTPSPRLVMITLLCVTFPIEIAFLTTLRLLGWLKVPFVFLVFSLMFFCIAVRYYLVRLCVNRPLTNHCRSSRRFFSLGV